MEILAPSLSICKMFYYIAQYINNESLQCIFIEEVGYQQKQIDPCVISIKEKGSIFQLTVITNDVKKAAC